MERDIKKLISEMTLEEKAGLCSGKDFWHTKSVERLNIPSVMLTDGPHGIRKQENLSDHLGLNESIKAVCFPAACATASSFDTNLMEKMGEILGEECQAENISVLLGPAANIKRSPLCGRNFEYLSEDPYLAGKMASAYIKGVQKWNVGTSMKHFAANNQEYNRMSCSSELSERTLREIYLAAFEMAVKEAQPKTIMCSYNKINGVFSSENYHLLTEILRDEWGFEGYVMTDWGAVADRVEGIKAGLELEMPSSNGINDAKIVEAVKNGTLDEDILNKTVERMLEVLFSYVDNRHSDAVFDRDKDHEKAVDIETECAVLLENNGILPLSPEKNIVYIGAYAKNPRYQGGGSSHINSSKITSAMESAIKKGRNVSYTEGFPYDGDFLNDTLLSEAVELAKKSDAAVIFAGLPDSFESEGIDRKNMKMPECQTKLITEVSKVQPNTIVVLHNGSPVEVPWKENVAAILEMYLGGQGVGEACDRLLYGEGNPSGHLAETFPYRLEDNPSFLNFPGDGKKVNYAEGVYVGYRYYDAKKIPVRWPFGHGLSYTAFSYSNIKLSSKEIEDDGEITINADITNSGDRAGKEVVQLYISDKNDTPLRPIKELKGFTKVMLNPKETKTVSFTINARDLSFYHEELKDWYAPSGSYEILIGSSSADIRLRETFTFTTKKYLPFTVSGATTIGELIKDRRTASIIKEMMEKSNDSYFSPAILESDEKEDVEKNTDDNSSEKNGSSAEIFSKEALRAQIFSTPLKSLLSFGMMKGDEMEGLIAMLNQAVINYKES